MNNPMQIISRYMGVNPIIKDLVEKAQKGDSKSVENFARNLCKEKGIDFDKEFAQFMSNFKK